MLTKSYQTMSFRIKGSNYLKINLLHPSNSSRIYMSNRRHHINKTTNRANLNLIRVMCHTHLYKKQERVLFPTYINQDNNRHLKTIFTMMSLISNKIGKKVWILLQFKINTVFLLRPLRNKSLINFIK